MKHNDEETYLQFDFSANGPVAFKDPITIISTWDIDEVEQCLDRIKQLIEKGFYAAGYISYEAAYAFGSQTENAPKISMPLLWFGIYNKTRAPSSLPRAHFSISEWQLTQSRDDYEKVFQKIKEAIERGETEQVNYTVKFEADFSGSALPYYDQLKRAQQGSYSAYLNTGKDEILSASPELFFHAKNDVVTVKPMKGTIHRGKTYEEDLRNLHWLKTSEKNKMENELILSLMRNELKNVATEESIRIVKRYEVEKYPTVYQMTSTIQGTVRQKFSAIDILKNLFPCGSISGVPKQTTMDLIAQLEKNARDVYCGAIGYITPENEAIFNVPIRTVAIDRRVGKASYGAGGAITIDSELGEEYKEVLTKAKILREKREPFELIETFGLINRQYIVFEEHLKRLQHSAAYFDFPIDIDLIKKKLLQYKKEYVEGKWRLRLLVDENGKESWEVYPLEETDSVKASLAKTPIDKLDPFLYHKTTNRKIYNEKLKEIDGASEALLWNGDREITEFTIGNVVVDWKGRLLTPPLECGLLPGTFRERLLQEGVIEEEKIYLDQLNECTFIWLINSVRKWVPVYLA